MELTLFIHLMQASVCSVGLPGKEDTWAKKWQHHNTQWSTQRQTDIQLLKSIKSHKATLRKWTAWFEPVVWSQSLLKLIKKNQTLKRTYLTKELVIQLGIKLLQYSMRWAPENMCYGLMYSSESSKPPFGFNRLYEKWTRCSSADAWRKAKIF